MSDIAIKVEGLSKRYKIGRLQRRHDTLRDRIADARVFNIFKRRNGHNGNSQFAIRNSQSDTLWALKDVSFEVKRGEVIGIIGRNGAGKSTLLKILSRITEPTEGYAEIHGRIASLLEVGTGFHPELTGRENIYLNGAILGMKRDEIKRKFDEIVDFAEVEKFIDTPVKRFSSGMYLRLAFAVAAYLEPEILLVDEVLAVGDSAFQKKCVGKMRDVGNAGRTVLFVSHNMGAIASLCSRSIHLSQGCVFDDGKTSEVISRYVAEVRQKVRTPLADRTDRWGSGEIKFTDVQFVIGEGVRTQSLICGQDAYIELHYRSLSRRGPLGKLSVSATFSNLDGLNVCCFWDRLANAELKDCASSGILRCHIHKLPLMPGNYTLLIALTHDGGLSDKISDAAEVVVSEGDFFGNGFLPPSNLACVLVEHRWEFYKQ